MAEVITVSALNRYVKTLLDANDALFDLAPVSYTHLTLPTNSLV